MNDTTTDAHGPRARTALIVLLILLAGAGVGVFLRESDSGGTARAATTSPSTELIPSTRPPSTVTVASTSDTGAPPTTGLALGTQSGSGTPTNTVPIKPATHTTSAPTTTTTTLPKPIFTLASATPGAVYCNGTNTATIVIKWATTEATSVDLQLDGQGPRTAQPTAATFMGAYACSSSYATLTAHGPGGDTTTTVNWNHLQAPPG